MLTTKDIKDRYLSRKLVMAVQEKGYFNSLFLVNYPPTAEPMGWASGVNTPTNGRQFVLIFNSVFPREYIF